MGSVNKKIDNVIVNEAYYSSPIILNSFCNINFNTNTPNYIANIVISPISSIASNTQADPLSLFHTGDIIELYDGSTTDYGVINNVSINGDDLVLDIEQINGNGFNVSSNLVSITILHSLYNINFNISTPNHIANILISPISSSIPAYPASLFHTGDIIGLYDGTTTDYGVINNVSVNGNTLVLDIEQINGNGFIVSSNLESIANVKPVFKNQFTTEVGNIVAQELTVNGTNISFDKIVNASAVEYSDVWPKSCLQDCYSDPKNAPNDYVSGRKGVWRPYKAYQYRTERLYKNESQNDGFYAKFTPFNWNDVMLNDPNWIVLNTITKYSPYGFELENKDPLGNYSAALYGYHNSLATAIAKNAKYNEIAFDSFEEENQSCNSSHLSFILNNDATIIDTEAHSGNKSLKISNGATQTITVNL